MKNKKNKNVKENREIERKNFNDFEEEI